MAPTHHGLFDYSYLRVIPNIVVMAPKDENELQHMLKTAVECGGPVSIRYPRGGGVGVSLDRTLESIEIGKAQIVREGKDVAVIAIGSTVYPSLEAAQKLVDENIQVTVVNSRFVKPLDRTLLCEVASSFKKVITVEENALMGGFGSAVLELFGETGISGAEVKRLGIGDAFVEQGTQTQLRKQQGIDAQGIAQAVRKMMVP